MGRLRRHITYANVVATLALVLAAGSGGVYAANKIGGSQIRKGAVRSIQIKNRQVRRQDIAGGSINSRKVSNSSLTGKDVRRDSLTGLDVDEPSLGLVPLAQDARTLGGVTLRTVRASQPEDGSGTAVAQAGLSVLLSCPGGVATTEVRGTSPGDFGTVFDTDSNTVLLFDSTSAQTVATVGLSNPGIASVRRADGTLTRLDFEMLSIGDGLGTQDDCFLNGVLASGK